jgi:hypothetical protein
MLKRRVLFSCRWHSICVLVDAGWWVLLYTSLCMIWNHPQIIHADIASCILPMRPSRTASLDAPEIEMVRTCV